MEIKPPTKQEMEDFLNELYIKNQFDKVNEEFKKEKEESIKAIRQEMTKVTPELFTEFLRVKGVKQECSRCGHDKYSIPESMTFRRELLRSDYDQLSGEDRIAATMDGVVSFVPFLTIGDADSRDIIFNSYFPTHCVNCGHLNLYRTKAVTTWIDNKDSDEEKQADE